MSQREPTSRFSDRVDSYVQSRPSYPSAVFELLSTECGLRTGWVVADVGSGTGILSRLFCARGHTVFGVEPNRFMRRAAERYSADTPSFISVTGTAEATTLPADSVDLIAAAQSFHWFDPEPARREFSRILKPQGWVVLIWNDRRKRSTPFLRDYERLLLVHGTDYRQVDHSRIGDERLSIFFAPQGYRSARFDNFQVFDFDGLLGRLLSSSYAPAETDPGYAEMVEALRLMFDTHQVDGRVAFEYDTRVFYGRLSRPRSGSPRPLCGRLQD